MNVLHVVPSLDLSQGGPSKSVSELAYNQALKGISVSIITNASPNPYTHDHFRSLVKIHFVSSDKFKNILISLLNQEKFDVLHGHGIWQMPVHYMAQLAIKYKIPYVVTPRGMLEPWALNSSKWKKKIAFALFQKRDLTSANFLHATADMEAAQFRKLGFHTPIAVIPNGIEVSEFSCPNFNKQSDEKVLLFLSRIHPKKGLELLIDAWELLDSNLREGWKVVIAGNGDESYVNKLQKRIDVKGLNEIIKIVGPKFGEDKIAQYHRANLFVLPTYSENFGIVIAEALACNTPVITTKGAPWEELEATQSGWWIDIGTEPLKEALEEALQTPPETLHQMGENGRKLIEEKYSIEAVAKQMLELYTWILEKGEKPEFVNFV